MDLNLVASFAAAAGTLLAGIALLLNYWQFRRIDGSIRGATNQQLSTFALEFLKLLLENPELSYLYTADAPDVATRKQRIFDRIVANYLENMWFQCQLGLVDGEIKETYHELLRSVLANHPGVAEHMANPNFASSLRRLVRDMVAEDVPVTRDTPATTGGTA